MTCGPTLVVTGGRAQGYTSAFHQTRGNVAYPSAFKMQLAIIGANKVLLFMSNATDMQYDNIMVFIVHGTLHVGPKEIGNC